MFKRPRHQSVLRLLDSLDPVFLEQNGCYFGGGTRIVLELDEYRESLDVDFLCADLDGYRGIRSVVLPNSLGPLGKAPLQLVREVRADRYGIRTFVLIGEVKVKFEIIQEGRIPLTHEYLPGIPVPCLDKLSCFAEKLLANADRWADRGVAGRDVIDLAFMAGAWGGIPVQALRRAETAYGGIILPAVERAVDGLLDNRAYLQACVTGMGMTDAGQVADHLAELRATCREL
jgi:hypothetical protein